MYVRQYMNSCILYYCCWFAVLLWDYSCFSGVFGVCFNTHSRPQRVFVIFRCSTFLLEACDLTAFPATVKHLCLHCSHTIWFPQETHIPIIHFSNHLFALLFDPFSAAWFHYRSLFPLALNSSSPSLPPCLSFPQSLQSQQRCFIN